MEIKSRVTPDALARLEMAREKVRIMEKRLSTAISELEQAAGKWQKQKELEPRGSRQMEPRSILQ